MIANSMNSLITEHLVWFDKYARRHEEKADDMVVELVQRKRRHTLRVLGHVRGILKTASIPAHLVKLAEISAILHDVGRFPQLVGRATFDDQTGYNHAEEGAAILRDSNRLNSLQYVERETVLAAVQYHNRAIIPTNLSLDATLVLKILRDADKLDAIRTNLRYMGPDSPHGKALKDGLIWHENKHSPHIAELVLNRQLVPYQDITWSNDFVLFVCCWIYDLHFHYAYKHLDRSGQFERLLAWLPDETHFPALKTQLRTDLSRFIAKG
ncbi:HD domain-containing protein [Pseudodesulfovibrio nedwellii]|nr:HD domain-containing protein [Pseudodesulfovibrio nedwellii]